MQAKEYYKTYLADDKLSALSRRLFIEISKENPNHIFEFGCGTGKNINHFEAVTCGMDISFLNVTHAYTKNLPFLILGDETHLRHLCNFDVVFTVSVLDHIQDISGIIDEFKRIANKAVFLAETTDTPGEFYYTHRYEDYGFEKVSQSELIDASTRPFSWTSLPPLGDGATYHIWKWRKVCAE